MLVIAIAILSLNGQKNVTGRLAADPIHFVRRVGLDKNDRRSGILSRGDGHPTHPASERVIRQQDETRLLRVELNRFIVIFHQQRNMPYFLHNFTPITL